MNQSSICSSLPTTKSNKKPIHTERGKFYDTKGYFGQFGGSFVPEPIQALLDELEVTFEKYKDDPEFLAEFRHYLKDYSGRETPLYFAEV